MSAPANHLHPGASEHYQNARDYEARYQSRTEDIEFYLRACRQAERVLEYGAGAGRLTLPLARAGKRVLAIDTSGPMLDLLKQRLADEPARVRARVGLRKGDMRAYSTRARFDVVIAAFHTVCHLYQVEELQHFLTHAWRHLHPGGSLLFDVPLPRIDVPGYDPIAQVRVCEMEGTQGPELLTQRWFHPQELLMHLHYCGYVRPRLSSDFGPAPPSVETSVVCVRASKPVGNTLRSGGEKSSSGKKKGPAPC